MCRRNQLWGSTLLAFGLGLLIGQLFDSGFLCTCIGIVLIGLGFTTMHRK